jgi:hypothetical protein
VYGESEVSVKVANGQVIKVIEETSYPFKEDIKFTFTTGQSIKFPFHLRIPLWCKAPVVKVNGEQINLKVKNGIIVMDRKWMDKDEVILSLPMEFTQSWWYNQSAGIERGPLVYALKIDEDWREVKKDGYDDTYLEVRPKSSWNYSLVYEDLEKKNFTIDIKDEIATYPWNLENAPIVVKTKGFRVPEWDIVNGSAGMVPSPGASDEIKKSVTEEIQLVPYGCTTLRISQFPVLK